MTAFESCARVVQHMFLSSFSGGTLFSQTTKQQSRTWPRGNWASLMEGFKKALVLWEHWEFACWISIDFQLISFTQPVDQPVDPTRTTEALLALDPQWSQCGVQRYAGDGEAHFRSRWAQGADGADPLGFVAVVTGCDIWRCQICQDGGLELNGRFGSWLGVPWLPRISKGTTCHLWDSL